MATAKNLVIVESPAKAKTIERYLGSGYKVTASMGHLRDLPKSKMGVDIENGFIPQYIPMKDKKEVIAELKKEAKNAKNVYLATDPDREGEAISWHLKELLEIPDEKVNRVTFNEITKKVVTESIQAPRSIDQDLVNAQQARRILDRIVGYELSPLLWKKVKRGLSAGRVQSVATRIVVDREAEINAFQPKEYWLLDAHVAGRDGEFTARYYGSEGKKRELPDETATDSVIADIAGKPLTVTEVKRSEKKLAPAAPFITSTLQQEASRKLSMTPRRTMSIAQQLYEGVEISGHGSIGLITYMRTDSLRLSDEAVAAAKDYIIGRYGDAYYPGRPRVFKTKAGAQDAHEAIRPTYADLDPESVRKDLTQEQYRLYRLIWGRFIACQMTEARYDNVNVAVECASHCFKANYSELKFPGFTAVYQESKDEESDELASPLPNLAEGQQLNLKKTTKEQRFTQPPVRYTEATLIRAMEEKGIGRPSTYAPTITTILSHDYVIKEGKYLKPTPLGDIVTGYLKDTFPDIVDLKFTNTMESELDSIESGSNAWQQVLAEFYDKFKVEMDAARDHIGEKLSVPDIVTDEVCEVCGRNMIVKKGRFGYFLGCPGFPECTFTKPIVEEMPGKCPKCGGRILKRKSRKGYVFYACERGTDCGFITWDVPVKDYCPACGKTLFKRSGRGALKPFCINEECSAFVPEDKRGYKKKSPASAETTAQENVGKAAEAVPDGKTAKKTGAKTSAARTAGTAGKTKKTAKTTKPTAKKSSAAAKTKTRKTSKEGGETE